MYNDTVSMPNFSKGHLSNKDRTVWQKKFPHKRGTAVVPVVSEQIENYPIADAQIYFLDPSWVFTNITES